MNLQIEVAERDGADHLPLITDELNRRFLAIKERNPRGYLDQFDSQVANICIDVAGELGGTVEETDNGTFRFNFLGCHLT